jgi:hypothetical protein
MWVPSASQILFWRSQKSLILRNHGLLTWADGRAGYLLDEELGEELSGSASRHG